MNDYLFLYLTAPGCPVVVYAVFPAERSVEAFDFVNQGGGYYTIRKAKWSMGKLPEFKDTEKV
jgi:hypothetical protein